MTFSWRNNRGISLLIFLFCLGFLFWFITKSSPPENRLGTSRPTSDQTLPGTKFQATVLEVIDGDTVKASIEAFRHTPFYRLSLRIDGIDTPETHLPLAKCPEEVKAGLAASDYARTLMKAGDQVIFTYTDLDKYGDRIDGHLQTAAGQDLGTLMLAKQLARPYSGQTKPDWCQILKGN